MFPTQQDAGVVAESCKEKEIIKAFERSAGLQNPRGEHQRKRGKI